MAKTAFVTGGSRGIGFGVASCLAREGCNVAVFGRRSQADVKPALDALRNLGAAVIYCRGDVTRPADRQAAMTHVRNTFGALHVMVNNAGVAPEVRADILEATEESYERVMKINLQGPYFFTQLAARWMVEQKQADPSFSGCIVNVSSVSATVASPNRGEYCLSKAGVSMATKLWAARLGEFDIPVYEVRPGVTRTDMTEAVTEKYDKLIADGLCLQRRWGFPEDVGKAVAMLARGDLPYSTGQVVMVDGGMTVPVL